MEWLIVIGLILFGLALIIAEVLFVPGTTIVGIAGFAFEIGGIYLAYDYFDAGTGNFVLGITFILSVTTLIVTFKTGMWQKLALKEENKGKVNEGSTANLKVGDKGKTISALRPIGKALFNDKEFEVRTNGEFLYDNLEIEIFKLDNNIIFVKPIEPNNG